MLVRLDLDCPEILERVDDIFQHGALLSVREVVFCWDQGLVLPHLFLPIEEEGMGGTYEK